MSNRSHIRRHTIHYIKVFEENTNRLTGHLADISTSGMRLISSEPIQPGSVHNFSMALPLARFGWKTVNFDAESIWCRHDANSNSYDTGFRFIGFSLERL